MIRQATLEDIPKIVEMGSQFYELVDLPVSYDPLSVAETMKSLIDSDLGAIFVDDKINGAIGALLYPHYFNHNTLTGGELFWWVNPEHRGRLGSQLLDTMEEWVESMGATSFQMIALEEYKPSAIGKIYENRGYRPLEHTYLRVI
jgi:GNAT superfamily N-acetyltransferase